MYDFRSNFNNNSKVSTRRHPMFIKRTDIRTKGASCVGWFVLCHKGPFIFWNF